VTYEPYPTAPQPPQAPQRREPPGSVMNAVKFMYAGAALTLVSLIIGLTTVSSIKKAIIKDFPHDTASQVHKLEVGDVIILVVIQLIGIGLWIWMARANQSGHGYARIVATVFFGIYTLLTLANFARPHASISLAFSVLVWLVGLGAILFLWNKNSAAYFAKTPTY
jgi:hypothetical protein